MKICDRCQKPITSADAYDEIIPDSMSAARPTSYLHKWPCWRDGPETVPEPPIVLTPENPRSRQRRRPRR